MTWLAISPPVQDAIAVAIAIATGAAFGYAGFSSFGLGGAFADEGGRFTPKTTSGFANGWGPFQGTIGIFVIRFIQQGQIDPILSPRVSEQTASALACSGR